MRGDEVQPDFVEFLLARIAEVEQAARVCSDAFPTPWEMADRGYEAYVTADRPYFRRVVEITQEQTTADWPGEHLEHIAKHSPDRVLADCAAKRSIIEAHPYGGDQSMPAHCCADPGDYLGEEMYHDEPCPTLAAMLSMYADHPDFEQGWLG